MGLCGRDAWKTSSSRGHRYRASQTLLQTWCRSPSRSYMTGAHLVEDLLQQACGIRRSAERGKAACRSRRIAALQGVGHCCRLQRYREHTATGEDARAILASSPTASTEPCDRTCQTENAPWGEGTTRAHVISAFPGATRAVSVALLELKNMLSQRRRLPHTVYRQPRHHLRRQRW